MTYIGRFHRPVEADNIAAATGKIKTGVKTADKNRDNARDDDGDREDIHLVPQTNEIDLYILEGILCPFVTCCDSHILVEHPFKEQPCDKDRRE